MATIIVVEDDLDINDIETIALKNIGYDVISCTCAGEFWEVMKHRTPELVLLDIMLEDEDGIKMLICIFAGLIWLVKQGIANLHRIQVNEKLTSASQINEFAHKRQHGGIYE